MPETKEDTLVDRINAVTDALISCTPGNSTAGDPEFILLVNDEIDIGLLYKKLMRMLRNLKEDE